MCVVGFEKIIVYIDGAKAMLETEDDAVRAI